MAAHRWPADSNFRKLVLDPSNEERPCGVCGRPMRICDHRHRRIYMFGGPLQVTCKLIHCADPTCPGSRRTVSPRAELDLAPPRWLIDWEVFAWLGQRRAARRSVAQLRAELAAEHGIELPEDALSYYVTRYAELVEESHVDLDSLREVYRDISSFALALDIVQPEHGLPALAVVREINARRVWLAAPLSHGAVGEVVRLLERARNLAATLERPVASWTTARHDALSTGLVRVFPDVPWSSGEPVIARSRIVTWRPAPSRLPSRHASVAPSCPPHSWHPPPQALCPAFETESPG